MPDWITDLLQTERLLTVAFVLFLLWMMGKAIFKAWPLLSKTVTLMNALVGGDDNPGLVKQMNSMAEKLTALTGKVDTIHHETTPNHGGSMKDAVNRIEQRVNEHIEIAKESDERQDKTGQIVDDYLPKIKQLLGEDE